MIYFLLNSYEPNQAQTNRLLAYFSALDKTGSEAVVVFLFPNANGDKLMKKYENISIRHMWNKYVGNNSLIRYFRYRINLWRFMRGLKKNDVVYTYGLNKTAKKLVENSHIKVVAEITEHPSIIDGGRITAISQEEKYCIARKLHRLFVISTSLKKLFVEHGVNEDAIQIINMIVDSHRFSDIQKQKLHCSYIAYCGNASNNKDGVDKLLKSFAIVNKSHPDIKLYIIGRAPSSDVEDSNLKLAESLHIIDNVCFTGVVPSEKMPQLLVNAEVMVLNRPNSIQAQYGFPTKLGEYLLTGNPVVVTKVGDIPSFLQDGHSALIANPEDDRDFATKLSWALDNPEEARTIGHNGKDVALRHFNSDIEFQKILNCIQ